MSRTPYPPALEKLLAQPLPVPGAPLPTPAESAALEGPVTAASALVDIVEDSVLYALARKDARAYFETIATQKPDLFFKYVALAVDARKNSGAPSRVTRVISPLAPSPLDQPQSS